MSDPVVVQNRAMTSETIGKLALALSKAQGQMSPAIKDKKNPFYGSMYADLAGVWDACRKALSENELAVIQTTMSASSDEVTICTRLCHSSGEWISGELILAPVPKDRKDSNKQIIGVLPIGPQEITAAITYGRRVALASIVGVATEDDDGERAHGRNGSEAPQAEESFDLAVPATTEGTFAPKDTPSTSGHTKAAKDVSGIPAGERTSAYDGRKLEQGENPLPKGKKKEPAAPASAPAATTAPAATEPTTPPASLKNEGSYKTLFDLMARDGVGEAELCHYARFMTFLQNKEQKVTDIPQFTVDKMILPDNWAKVIKRIPEALKKDC